MLEGETERVGEEATVFYGCILRLLERLRSPCIRKKIGIPFKNSIAILANNITNPRHVIAGIQGKSQSKFGVLISVTMKSIIFWVVMRCNSLQIH
jgi:hypothetical protein